MTEGQVNMFSGEVEETPEIEKRERPWEIEDLIIDPRVAHALDVIYMLCLKKKKFLRADVHRGASSGSSTVDAALKIAEDQGWVLRDYDIFYPML